MNFTEYKKKVLKEDIILNIFHTCTDKNGKIVEKKLEKYLKVLIKSGKLKN